MPRIRDNDFSHFTEEKVNLPQNVQLVCSRVLYEARVVLFNRLRATWIILNFLVGRFKKIKGHK